MYCLVFNTHTSHYFLQVYDQLIASESLKCDKYCLVTKLQHISKIEMQVNVYNDNLFIRK